LADHPTGRSKQPAVAPPQPLLALRSLGARRSGNVEHAQFDAPTAVAQFRSDVADDRGDLLHRPRQNPHAVAKQARIGRIVDIGLHYRGVDPHPPAGRNSFRLRHLHEPFVHLLDGLRPDRQSPTTDRLGVRHLAAADAGEVAIDQVGAHFALENRVAPVAHVLENQQAQNHIGRRAQPTASAAFGMSPPQRFVNRRDDRLIVEQPIGVVHPSLAQIRHFVGDQSVAEAALRPPPLNHWRFLREPAVASSGRSSS
jgi:hypothetical protein